MRRCMDMKVSGVGEFEILFFAFHSVNLADIAGIDFGVVDEIVPFALSLPVGRKDRLEGEPLRGLGTDGRLAGKMGLDESVVGDLFHCIGRRDDRDAGSVFLGVKEYSSNEHCAGPGPGTVVYENETRITAAGLQSGKDTALPR